MRHSLSQLQFNSYCVVLFFIRSQGYWINFQGSSHRKVISLLSVLLMLSFCFEVFSSEEAPCKAMFIEGKKEGKI